MAVKQNHRETKNNKDDDQSDCYDRLDQLRDQFILRPTNSSSSNKKDSFYYQNYNQKQFSNVYYSRLSRLRKERLIEKCKNYWKLDKNDESVRMSRVLDIGPERTSIVIGTVYCEMKLKPNVLDDLARDHHLGPGIGLRKWVTEESERDDPVMLEDESGRVRLVGIDKDKWTLVTGIIIGVRGKETEKGDFRVEDLVYAGTPAQKNLIDPKNLQKNNNKLNSNNKLVGLVSGLELDGNKSSKSSHRVESLIQFINGEIGEIDELSISKRIIRLIIAGNSIKSKALMEFESKTSSEKKSKKLGSDPTTNLNLKNPLPIDQLDESLDQIKVPIDLIPGPTDPTISTLPQQPLHRCLLPLTNQSKDQNNFVNGPNPWWAKICGTTFLGTSGQNIDDLFKYVIHEDRLKLAKQTLEWSHIAPTAPDTLWCYPFKDNDPFVLSELPNVYFIGNQPKFETELIKIPNESGKGEKLTRVILLPRFSKTGMLVLIDPITLDYQLIQFLKDFNKLDNDDDQPDEGQQRDDDDDSDGDGDGDGLGERIVLDMDADDDDE